MLNCFSTDMVFLNPDKFKQVGEKSLQATRKRQEIVTSQSQHWPNE